ncbi:hypothetical protein JNUCC64_28635 [Streptomyces sp. JNUCC 64]
MADDDPVPDGPGYGGAPRRTRPEPDPGPAFTTDFAAPAPPGPSAARRPSGPTGGPGPAFTTGSGTDFAAPPGPSAARRPSGPTGPSGGPGPASAPGRNRRTAAPPPPAASARFPDEPPPEPRGALRPPRRFPAPGAPHDPLGSEPPHDAPGSELPGAGPVHRPRPPHQGRPAHPAPRHPAPGPDGTPGFPAGAAFPAGASGHPRSAPPGRYGPAAPFDDEPVHRLPVDAFPDPVAPGPAPGPTGFARYRAATAAACAILGLGLIGGAVTGSWLTGDSTAAPRPVDGFSAARELWHNTPVDELFPRVVRGDEAGPGGADRVWHRVAVAPDTTCAKGLAPRLRQVLAPVGCERLLRATYTDATRSHLTTVGLLFTTADAPAMRALRTRFAEGGLDRHRELMPRAYGPQGTPAAGFGDQQRAAWTLSVRADAPVITYAVSGFADGRVVTDPEPAVEAARGDGTSAPSQSGLGHEAKGLADRVERALRQRVAGATEKAS